MSEIRKATEVSNLARSQYLAIWINAYAAVFKLFTKAAAHEVNVTEVGDIFHFANNTAEFVAVARANKYRLNVHVEVSGGFFYQMFGTIRPFWRFQFRTD